MNVPLVSHPAYSTPLPEEHRFPMAKFRLLVDHLRKLDLLREHQLHQPLPVPRRWLELVHPRVYHEAFARHRLSPAEARRIGLPATSGVIRRSWLAVGGTVLTARLALQHGLACHLAGGTHHAHGAVGSGFCIFNDVAVAAHVLLAEGLVERILVVDLDVHQGDGTASLFADDPRVFTFSAHAESNFPLRKATSDCDLPLPDGMEDEPYLGAVGGLLPDLLSQVRPNLVFYNAGVDPHRQDRLGRLSLSDSGLLQRERMVLETCLSQRIPVATVIGGGYDALTPLVERHGLVVRAAADAALLHHL
ncbi:MAG: histone deacetylase [Cyanobacteriota bacterium]|nr:histone deacetylase [Cyanobacteriota bacterium]